MRILITGGAGFVGSALVNHLLSHTENVVLNIDKLTYAGSLDNLTGAAKHANYHFIEADICDTARLEAAYLDFRPQWVMHLAAESHVDRSISNGSDFVQTNIVGTHRLLEAALIYWQTLDEEARAEFRFLHVSSDEVFGSLADETRFSETSPYNPSSPYSASKAAADHLVKAWGKTYGLPVLISNSSNTYGAHQLPEKLIPKLVLCAALGQEMPLYGNGEQIRDWLYVEDHVSALVAIIANGQVGENYNVGANCEWRNIDVALHICRIFGELRPSAKSYERLITSVADRPGHDVHYGVDASKLANQLGWMPQTDFDTGLRRTIRWYLNNQSWCASRVEEMAGGPFGPGQVAEHHKEDVPCASL